MDPEPTAFFSDFKDAKKIIFFSYVFLITCGDLYLWLMNPDLTPFFSYFRMQKKIIFSYFFLITYVPAGTLSSVLKIYLFGVKILFCKHNFSPLNTFMIKGKDPDPKPDPNQCLLINGSGSGSGRPKSMRILRIQIRIPNTGSNPSILRHCDIREVAAD